MLNRFTFLQRFKPVLKFKPLPAIKSVLMRAEEKVLDVMDQYDDIMREGGYHAPHETLFRRLFNPSRKRAVETTAAMAGQLGTGTAKKLLDKILFGTAIALMSSNVALTLGITLAVLGIGFKVKEFFDARSARKDIIRERNFAEQVVEGTRADLCRLHVAQYKIMNLSEVFERASLISASETIDRIIADVEPEISRVKVIEPGRYGADTLRYDFSEGLIKLVNRKTPRAANANKCAAPQTVTAPVARNG